MGNDFHKGERVELHPATDLWMRGARFGTIVKALPVRRAYLVKLDKVARTRRIRHHDLLPVR